jgi:hypothetical protein
MLKPEPLGTQQWEQLQALDHHDVCARLPVRFDGASQAYYVPFMGKEYVVSLESKAIGGPEHDSLVQDDEFMLLLLVYLLSARNVPLAGKWVSEKEIQGGALFFKGPHALPIQLLIGRFGSDVSAFIKTSKACGGKSINEYGDAAFIFQALPSIPVMCILWAADDEFPARVSFLFDPSIESQLPLDVILALVRCIAINLLNDVPS